MRVKTLHKRYHYTACYAFWHIGQQRSSYTLCGCQPGHRVDPMSSQAFSSRPPWFFSMWFCASHVSLCLLVSSGGQSRAKNWVLGGGHDQPRSNASFSRWWQGCHFHIPPTGLRLPVSEARRFWGSAWGSWCERHLFYLCHQLTIRHAPTLSSI